MPGESDLSLHFLLLEVCSGLTRSFFVANPLPLQPALSLSWCICYVSGRSNCLLKPVSSRLDVICHKTCCYVEQCRALSLIL